MRPTKGVASAGVDGRGARLRRGGAGCERLGGAITAALFLRRFVGEGRRFAHFDIYGWSPNGDAARPKGGVGQGARALLDALPAVLDL